MTSDTTDTITDANHARAQVWIEKYLLAPLSGEQVTRACDVCGRLAPSDLLERASNAILAVIRAKGDSVRIHKDNNGNWWLTVKLPNGDSAMFNLFQDHGPVVTRMLREYRDHAADVPEPPDI